MNDKNLYCAIIRNAEALRGKNVSQDAAKKVSFQSFFKVAKGSELTTFSGNEFQTVGAATDKVCTVKKPAIHHKVVANKHIQSNKN